MKWILRNLHQRLQFLTDLARQQESIHELLATQYREPILAAEKLADPKKLTPYGFTAYSQADEDGLLQEIYRRIGTANKQFLEFEIGRAHV